VIKCCPVGNGPKQQVVEEDNQIYNNAGIEVKPEFQEEWIFYGYVLLLKKKV
jgi:protein TonB